MTNMFKQKKIKNKFLGLTAFKGISGEEWVDGHMKSLEDLKSVMSVAAPETPDIEESYFSVIFIPADSSVGVQMRTFFLCSLTGLYEFYFSCSGACEWFIKKSEDIRVNVTGRGMKQQDFEK